MRPAKGSRGISHHATRMARLLLVGGLRMSHLRLVISRPWAKHWRMPPPSVSKESSQVRRSQVTLAFRILRENLGVLAKHRPEHLLVIAYAVRKLARDVISDDR